jgi:hypothetical protein
MEEEFLILNVWLLSIRNAMNVSCLIITSEHQSIRNGSKYSPASPVAETRPPATTRQLRHVAPVICNFLVNLDADFVLVVGDNIESTLIAVCQILIAVCLKWIVVFARGFYVSRDRHQRCLIHHTAILTKVDRI